MILEFHDIDLPGCSYRGWSTNISKFPHSCKNFSFFTELYLTEPDYLVFPILRMRSFVCCVQRLKRSDRLPLLGHLYRWESLIGQESPAVYGSAIQSFGLLSSVRYYRVALLKCADMGPLGVL